MIRRLELSNVRIFEGSGWSFELRPLTVFCGANSAGKSTLLKIPLLLRQSQSQTQGRDGRLYLAGSGVDFGDYRTFVSNGETARKVVISITTDLPMSSSTIDSLRPGKKSRKKADAKPAENIVKPGELRCEFTFSPPKPRGEASGGRPAEQGADGASLIAVLESASFQIVAEASELLQWKVVRSESRTATSDQYEIYLPADYFRQVGGFSFMSVEQKGAQVQFTATLDGVLPFTIIGRAKRARAAEGQSESPSSDSQEIQFPLPPLIQQALWSLQAALNSTSYLGPLRSPAKRYYVAHLEANRDLDPTGEFLPYVLRDRAQDRVTNVPPGERKIVPQALEEALDGWVHYLRTGEPPPKSESSSEVLLSTTKQVLVQISVKSPSGSKGYALADSGVGYSQVLPILVRGLLAEEGSTFIVEQPELHLNPSLQVRLAEFFVSMVRGGKQVLIETHSEHLVNAIRVLTAEDEAGDMSEKSLIYFIDTSTARPVLRELSVKKDGTIPDWPRYFFGEAVELTGRLLRAQKRFRASASGTK
jgi:predicted ATPase